MYKHLQFVHVLFCFSENVDSMLLKTQISALNVHSTDAVISSLTGGSSGSVGVPCSSNTGSVSATGIISSAASGPPQYDISYVFQDTNKLAKNAKRSYESQVSFVVFSHCSAACFF